MLGRWAVWSFGGIECWGGGLSGVSEEWSVGAVGCLVPSSTVTETVVWHVCLAGEEAPE